MTGYLTLARPGRPARPYLFTCVAAPYGPLSAGLVGGIVTRACRRAGIPASGPHRLRHALACDLLAHGAALEEVAQLLRHSDLTMRRALGHRLEGQRRLLLDFAAKMDRASQARLTTAAALDWAASSAGAGPVTRRQRLSVIRCFARHLVLPDTAAQQAAITALEEQS
jgi:hypothetical protein